MSGHPLLNDGACQFPVNAGAALEISMVMTAAMLGHLRPSLSTAMSAVESGHFYLLLLTRGQRTMPMNGTTNCFYHYIVNL